MPISTESSPGCAPCRRWIESRPQKIEHRGLRQYGLRDAVALRAGAFLARLRRLQIGAEMARALDYAPADRQPLRRKLPQRALHVIDVERSRQCGGIVCRLGDAGGDMRARDKCRIADDG